MLWPDQVNELQPASRTFGMGREPLSPRLARALARPVRPPHQRGEARIDLEAVEDQRVVVRWKVHWPLLDWLQTASDCCCATCTDVGGRLVTRFPYPPNLFVRGNPDGGSLPAVARSLVQSASSAIVRVNWRPEPSVQVSPASALNTFTSDKPPSL